MPTEAQKAINLIIDLEGGLADDPNDPGQITKYGISLRAHPHLGREGIKNLTREDAFNIYKSQYWSPIAARVRDPALRLLAFDAAVNHGVRRAVRWLETYDDVPSFLAHRLRFYTRLSTWPHFGRGWTSRVAKVMEAIGRLEGDAQRVDTLIDNRGLFTRLSAAVRGHSGPVAYRVRRLVDGVGWKMDVRDY